MKNKKLVSDLKKLFKKHSQRTAQKAIKEALHQVYPESRVVVFIGQKLGNAKYVDAYFDIFKKGKRCSDEEYELVWFDSNLLDQQE